MRRLDGEVLAAAMKFKVTIERTYRARHVHILEIEAPCADIAKCMAALSLDSDEIDPSEDYVDTNQEHGYDDCDNWQVVGVEQVGDQ